MHMFKQTDQPHASGNSSDSADISTISPPLFLFSFLTYAIFFNLFLIIIGRWKRSTLFPIRKAMSMRSGEENEVGWSHTVKVLSVKLVGNLFGEQVDQACPSLAGLYSGIVWWHVHGGNRASEDVRRSLKARRKGFQKTRGCFCSKHAFGLPLVGFWSPPSVRFCLFGQSSWVDLSPLNSDNSCLVMTSLAAFFSRSFSCFKTFVFNIFPALGRFVMTLL